MKEKEGEEDEDDADETGRDREGRLDRFDWIRVTICLPLVCLLIGRLKQEEEEVGLRLGAEEKLKGAAESDRFNSELVPVIVADIENGSIGTDFEVFINPSSLSPSSCGFFPSFDSFSAFTTDGFDSD